MVLEIVPTLGKLFREHPLIHTYAPRFELHTVFISPLESEEIVALQQQMGFATADEAVAAVMLPKLVGRSLQQGKRITPKEMEDLRVSASHAYPEIVIGKTYQTIIINHDGEDSNNWRFSPPIGEVGKTLQQFIKILTNL